MTIYTRSRRAFLALAAGAAAGTIPKGGRAAPVDAPPEHGTLADGLHIYLGVIPSQIISRDFAQGTAEFKMHGAPPRGAHYHHVMIAIFDAKTDERILNADVTATVTPLGVSSETKKLTPFTVGGALTYCNYFDMPFYGPYRIDLEIRRPGVGGVTKVQLKYRHDKYN